MKRLMLSAALILLLLTSCHKSGINLFRGDYSYKMTGRVVLTPLYDTDIEPLNFDITNEIGNLNITTLDKDNDSVLVIMNAINGGITSAHAHCEGDKIIFADFDHGLKLTNIAQGVNANCIVSVKAQGTMYDDNTILVEMVFKGCHKYLGNEYSVNGDDIVMAVYRNDK